MSNERLGLGSIVRALQNAEKARAIEHSNPAIHRPMARKQANGDVAFLIEALNRIGDEMGCDEERIREIMEGGAAD